MYYFFSIVPESPIFFDTVAKYGTDDKKMLINFYFKFAEVVSENIDILMSHLVN